MFYLVYQASSAFFPLICHQYRIISISQIRNIDSTECDSFHIFHGFFITNSLYRLKGIGDITQLCLSSRSTLASLLSFPSHLTAALISFPDQVQQPASLPPL